jgi:hypothetical protein
MCVLAFKQRRAPQTSCFTDSGLAIEAIVLWFFYYRFGARHLQYGIQDTVNSIQDPGSRMKWWSVEKSGYHTWGAFGPSVQY